MLATHLALKIHENLMDWKKGIWKIMNILHICVKVYIYFLIIGVGRAYSGSFTVQFSNINRFVCAFVFTFVGYDLNKSVYKSVVARVAAPNHMENHNLLHRLWVTKARTKPSDRYLPVMQYSAGKVAVSPLIVHVLEHFARSV